MYLASDAGERRAWTGTIQLNGDQIRFGTVGFNTALLVPAEQVEGIRGAVGHCVRIEGVKDASALIHVEGWAILPDGTEFTEGGLTYTCSALKGLLTIPGVVPNPAPPVTGGGTVTTTGTLPPGTDPTTAPPVTTPGAEGGGISPLALAALAAGGLFLFLRPGRN